MNRKPSVPKNISAEWRKLGLPRDVSVEFWNYIWHHLPERYERIRGKRDQAGGFRHKKVIRSKSDQKAYLFIMSVDDETSPDHLIITDLQLIQQ